MENILGLIKHVICMHFHIIFWATHLNANCDWVTFSTSDEPTRTNKMCLFLIIDILNVSHVDIRHHSYFSDMDQC